VSVSWKFGRLSGLGLSNREEPANQTSRPAKGREPQSGRGRRRSTQERPLSALLKPGSRPALDYGTISVFSAGKKLNPQSDDRAFGAFFPRFDPLRFGAVWATKKEAGANFTPNRRQIADVVPEVERVRKWRGGGFSGLAGGGLVPDLLSEPLAGM